MIIGLFTDSYLPRVDGVTFSVEIFRKELERMGHTVYVIAPAPALRYKETSPNIVRFPAIKGLIFDDYPASLFFPPQAMQKIKKLNLDLVHFQTPGQIGLLGANFALRNNLPLVTTYHTDLYEYVTHYPQVLPGIIALSLMSPLITRGGMADVRRALSSIAPQRRIDDWSRKIIVQVLTRLHNTCDAVIVPSKKIERQLRAWETTAPIKVLPTGVDPLSVTPVAVEAFRAKYGLQLADEVVLFVGRLGTEKNLQLLLEAFPFVVTARPHAKLVLVGKHEKQWQFEQMAQELGIAGRTVFTGHIERRRLGAAYGAADVFAFPSVADTQALTIHEAAHAGLPIVMVDRGISPIVIDGKSGLFAADEPADFAAKIVSLLADQPRRAAMGQAAKAASARYTGAAQARKLVQLYEEVMATHRPAPVPRLRRGLRLRIGSRNS